MRAKHLSTQAMHLAAGFIHLAILRPHNHVLDVPRAWLWAFLAITKYRRLDRQRRVS